MRDYTLIPMVAAALLVMVMVVLLNLFTMLSGRTLQYDPNNSCSLWNYNHAGCQVRLVDECRATMKYTPDQCIRLVATGK